MSWWSPASILYQVVSGAAVAVDMVTRNNRFASLLKYEAAPGEELRRDEQATDQYHGRAVDGTLTSAASWEVVRLYLDANGVVVRSRYRTGVVWDQRDQGWS